MIKQGMAISFEKHRNQITAAWKDVLDDDSETNWALYSYEGPTNELKMVGTGCGGLEELMEELNYCGIMYAFLCLEDPKSGLRKFVLINWQGEGAPFMRKAICANHVKDVATLLSGAHMIANARNEDDLDLKLFFKRLNSIDPTYNLKQPRKTIYDPNMSVETNCKRFKPAKELDPKVRKDFWRKAKEEEEKRRILTIHMQQSEKQKALQLIGSRFSEARAIFIQNTFEGQLARPIKCSIIQRINFFKQKEALSRATRTEKTSTIPVAEMPKKTQPVLQIAEDTKVTTKSADSDATLVPTAEAASVETLVPSNSGSVTAAAHSVNGFARSTSN